MECEYDNGSAYRHDAMRAHPSPSLSSKKPSLDIRFRIRRRDTGKAMRQLPQRRHERVSDGELTAGAVWAPVSVARIHTVSRLNFARFASSLTRLWRPEPPCNRSEGRVAEESSPM